MNRLLTALAMGPLVLARSGSLHWQRGGSCPCEPPVTVTATVYLCEADDPFPPAVVTKHVLVQPLPAPQTVTVSLAAPPSRESAAATPDPDVAGAAQEPTAVVAPPPTAPPRVESVVKASDCLQTPTKPGGDVHLAIIGVVAGEATCRREHAAGPCAEDPAAPPTLLCPPAVNATSVATVYRTVLVALPHNAAAEAAAPSWPWASTRPRAS